MRKMRKYNFWIHLNAEGKKIYGHIFPDLLIPTMRMTPILGDIEGRPTKIYIIDHKAMPEKQLDKLIKFLAGNFEAPEEAIKKQMEDIGIPIRANLVSSAGTDNIGRFI